MTLACRVEICQINLMRAKCAAALRVSAADYELSCWPAAALGRRALHVQLHGLNGLRASGLQLVRPAGGLPAGQGTGSPATPCTKPLHHQRHRSGCIQACFRRCSRTQTCAFLNRSAQPPTPARALGPPARAAPSRCPAHARCLSASADFAWRSRCRQSERRAPVNPGGLLCRGVAAGQRSRAHMQDAVKPPRRSAPPLRPLPFCAQF